MFWCSQVLDDSRNGLEGALRPLLWLSPDALARMSAGVGDLVRVSLDGPECGDGAGTSCCWASLEALLPCDLYVRAAAVRPVGGQAPGAAAASGGSEAGAAADGGDECCVSLLLALALHLPPQLGAAGPRVRVALVARAAADLPVAERVTLEDEPAPGPPWWRPQLSSVGLAGAAGMLPRHLSALLAPAVISAGSLLACDWYGRPSCLRVLDVQGPHPAEGAGAAPLVGFAATALAEPASASASASPRPPPSPPLFRIAPSTRIEVCAPGSSADRKSVV